MEATTRSPTACCSRHWRGWRPPSSSRAIAVTASAAAFEALAYGQFGEDAWLGSVWFAAATVTILLSGRLAFAAGLAPALAAALALRRRAPVLAGALAALSALLSPVAALFAALAGAATALGSRSRTEALAGAGVVAAALAPLVVIAVLFGDGGREPFTLSAFWPIPLLAVVALLALAPEQRTLRAGVLLYALGCAAAYLFVTPVGGNAARLAALLAGPLAALLLVAAARDLAADRCRAAALPAVAGSRPRSQRRGGRPVDHRRLLSAAAALPACSERAAIPDRDPVHRESIGRHTRWPRSSRSRAAGSASSTSVTTCSSTARS